MKHPRIWLAAAFAVGGFAVLAMGATNVVQVFQGGTGLGAVGPNGTVLTSNGDGGLYYSTIIGVDGGGGTVTSVSTTAPITGGPITNTGTIGCATCLTSGWDAGGDVSGTFGALRVVGIQGAPVADAGVSAGNVLTYTADGGDWVALPPATSGTVTSIATTGPITGGTITSSGTIACATCVTTGTAVGGDVVGTTPAETVIKIQGVPVADAGVVNGDVLVYASDGGNWFGEIPLLVGSGGTGVTSFASFSSTAINVAITNGSGIAQLTHAKDQVLQSNDSNTMSFSAIDLGSGTPVFAGILPVPNGGTGANLSASAGVVKDASGAFTASPLVNADVDVAAAIARSKLAAGTAHATVVNDSSGNMTGVAPSMSGNVLASDGTDWVSRNPASGVLWISPATQGGIRGSGLAGNFTIAMAFNIQAPITVTGVRWNATTSGAKNWKVRIFDGTSDVVTPVTVTGLASGTNTISFGSGAVLTDLTKTYYVSAYETSGTTYAQFTSTAPFSLAGGAVLLGPAIWLVDLQHFAAGDADPTSGGSTGRAAVEPVFTVP